MPVHDDTLSAIEAFYDAALDDSLWGAALQKLSELTHSQAASFWVLDGPDSPRLPTFISINFDPHSVQQYLGGMAAIDPTNRYLLGHPQQAIVHDGLLGDKYTRDRDTRAYYDWHERNVETRFRMVGQAQVAQSLQAGVALHRTRRTGAYEERDVSRFAMLHRHLQRALVIGSRLGTLGAMQRLNAEWLDQNSSGIIFLDDRRRVIFANRSMQELQSQNDGIRFSTQGLVLLGRRDNARLQTMLARATSAASPLQAGTCGIVATRPSGKRPYSILVMPVSTASSVLSTVRPAACIVVSDPERQAMPQDQLLRIFLGLTAAEARLAALLASGEGLRSAAAQLGITYGSARARLAQIFQKTGTRRQGELVRLLLVAPPSP